MKKLPKYKSTQWKILQYERLKEAKKGHNYTYLNDKILNDLDNKNYKKYKFLYKDYTICEIEAKEAVIELRKTNHYARIFCESNKLRVKTFTVYYKEKQKKEKNI